MRLVVLSCAVVLALLPSGCGESTETTDISLIKGGKTYGGEVKFMSSDKVQSLFPLTVTDKYSLRITGQIFESLMRVDPGSMMVTPAIAESFQVKGDGKVFIFKIRNGIRFHDDDCFGGEGRELTAADVKYSLDFACSGNKLNAVGNALADHIKGAQEYYEKSRDKLPSGGVSGIKVNGDNVEITLNKPFVGFEKILAQLNIVIFAREAYEKYGDKIGEHPVGTGPFCLDHQDANGIRLKRNEHYWRQDAFGNQLPYLNSISMTYVNDKKSEMLAFRNSEIDLLLEIPVEEIENVLGTLQEARDGKNVKHKVESSNSLSIEYIGFNHSSPVFGKKEVRQALLLATNPTKIIDNYLEGDGYPPSNGFIPEMEGQNNSIRPVEYNPEKARSLLAAAGFPGGKGFPETTIYVNAIEGSKVHRLMQGFTDQVQKELNVKLNIRLCDYAEREAAIASGEAQIWRAGWIADYPDPQSFLSILYGNGMSSNVFHFMNSRFDQNYEAALVETNPDKRAQYLLDAAQQVTDDAVVIPILMDNMLIMVNARVKGVVANPMELLDFTEVFIKEPRN